MFRGAHRTAGMGKGSGPRTRHFEVRQQPSYVVARHLRHHPGIPDRSPCVGQLAVAGKYLAMDRAEIPQLLTGLSDRLKSRGDMFLVGGAAPIVLARCDPSP